MSSVFDIFADFELKKTWIILYLLNGLEENKGMKSKYIAKRAGKPQRQVVGLLIKLSRLELVDKQLIWWSEGFATHLWYITPKGKDLIESRIALDTKGHFRTLQQLNSTKEN